MLPTSAAPFNGYYMGTEVGARNFGDEGRYNMLPVIAEMMGLERRNQHMLWKDRALTELNTAVLWSFKEAGVRMVDHHTASAQHIAWEEQEKRKGCPVTGNWSWLVPPVAGSACPVFHRSYEDTEKIPGFFYRADS